MSPVWISVTGTGTVLLCQGCYESVDRERLFSFQLYPNLLEGFKLLVMVHAQYNDVSITGV